MRSQVARQKFVRSVQSLQQPARASTATPPSRASKPMPVSHLHALASGLKFGKTTAAASRRRQLARQASARASDEFAALNTQRVICLPEQPACSSKRFSRAAGGGQKIETSLGTQSRYKPKRNAQHSGRKRLVSRFAGKASALLCNAPSVCVCKQRR